MKKNVYGKWMDTEVPITGVFSYQNLEQWIYDEINNEGININLLEWENETVLDGRDPDEEEFYPDSFEEMNDLVGFIETKDEEESWYWFDGLKKGFKPDPKADYSAIFRTTVIQVVVSKWGIRCNHCSPCYPGQGDADSEGDFLAFSLPPELVDDASPLSKRIFDLKKEVK